MKLIKLLPYTSVLDGNETPCQLWQSDNNECEFQTDSSAGLCDTSGMYYGTDDLREPKFCARHFYQRVVSGNGVTNYTLSK
jgi:hypothetical protein